MKHHASAQRRGRAGRAAAWVGLVFALAIGLAGQAGCTHQQTRLQSADETEKDRYQVKTVGDVSAVGNPDPVPIAGVGLVIGLDGTGGESPPDGYRTMLEDALKKQGVKNVKEVLASPNNALVLVTAQVPPGTGKNEPLDVEVSLPPGSKATSLRGGYLRECMLYNYDFTTNLNPTFKGPRSGLLGSQVARAEGTLLVGFGDGDEEARAHRGRIWGGAKTLLDLPFTIVLNPDQQYARVAALVAERINQSFHGSMRGLPGSELASAKNQYVIHLRVPAQYKLNQPRFLRVVRLVPLQDSPDAHPEGGKLSYRQRLAADLLDPARTVTAALRLEALGQSSIATAKPGLESKHPLVRFCSAEVLAYLGSPSCGEELARTVQERPALRAFALTAMASLDEAVCQVKLGELLTTSEDDETRYGAFRALRTLNPANSLIEGEFLNESFWLHRVASQNRPLVHVTSSNRAEIVLFGEDARLVPPFSFLAGEFAITAGADDERCTIGHFPVHGGRVSRKQCSLKIEDVLRNMAEMGCLYPEAVELLQQADACRSLSCRVRCDALPQATSVYDLVKAGQSGKDQEGAAGLVPAGQDLGSTPTLYQTGYQPKPALARKPAGPGASKKDEPGVTTD
jgi:hypothetical protein